MPMTGSVIQLLTHANPLLNLGGQSRGAVTKSRLYKEIEEEEIFDWQDFTFNNINDAYGHILGYGPVTSRADPDLDGTPTRILNENDVDTLTLYWSVDVCRQPLKAGAKRILETIGLTYTDITMKRLGQKSHDPESDSKAREPDWSIFLHGSPDVVVVWGDSKCSSKWKSNPDPGDFMLRQNWLWPFRQMLTYCSNNNTRYGFIITPQELVALRIFLDKSAPLGRQRRIEYKSVPWSNCGPDKLTANLAIWALAMMGVNEGHRPIFGREDTLPLNVWWKDTDAQGKTTYEHHLSGLRLGDRPRGGDIRDRPSGIPGWPPQTGGSRRRNGSSVDARDSKRRRG